LLWAARKKSAIIHRAQTRSKVIARIMSKRNQAASPGNTPPGGHGRVVLDAAVLARSAADGF
jgi:hypothetical protein